VSIRPETQQALERELPACEVTISRANYDNDSARVTVRFLGGTAEVSEVVDPLEVLAGGARDVALDLYRRLREAELA
jgi:hypothetical protein